MKRIFIIPGLLLMCTLTQAQTLNASKNAATSSTVNYVIGQQDANSRVWQKIVRSTDKRGNTIYQTNQAYVELATGLNFWRNGRWNASQENIDISADGSSAAAINGQHQGYFPGDIYNGVIRLVTPEGKRLESQPIGLSYSDGNNSVLLAVVTNSTGAILPSGNQVIYTNAFDTLNADLLYTYTKAGFEQDVILRQQPPDPSSLGLNPATTRIQVLTEFLKSPRPDVRAATVPTDAGNLEDDSLDFGAMKMGEGKAFSIGMQSPSVGVSKRWLLVAGRRFLIEEVPVVSVAKQIDTLPPFAKTVSGTARPVISKNLILPPQRQVQTNPKAVFVAQATLPGNGLVLDYVTMISQTNWTFQGDTTYYISGTVNLSGTNTFEGGTVLKYTNGASVNLGSGSGLIWLGAAYRPVIFTARDDNTVGDAISGSSGSPTGYYASPALGIAYSTPQSISNFRIVWAQQALSVSGNSAAGFYDGQVIKSQSGLALNNSAVNLRNILFANLATNFIETSGSTVDVQNATFNNISYLASEGANNALTMNVTNSVLANVTNLFAGAYTNAFSAGPNGFYNCPVFGTGQVTNTFYPFQSVGAGSFYLTNGCIFTNGGTANIDPVLLADLQTRTVYPPPLIYTNVSKSGTWIPQVQRDTNAAPALGYHYAPIDYAVSGVTINGTLSLANGVAVASFQSVYAGSLATGFQVGSGDQLTSVGTALAHNQICHYTAVQEQPILWGMNVFQYAVAVVAWSGASTAVLYARFTDFNGLAGLGVNAVFEEVGVTGPKIGGGDPMEFNLRDCRVGPGWLACVTYQGTDANICINNLFDRGGILISDFDGDSPVTMQNNLIHNGYVNFDNEFQTYTWTIQNNFFDNTTLSYGGGLSEDHNGYWNTTQLPGDVNDVSVTNFIYASGPLGNYYQVSTNLLNKGSTTAAAMGLYHYTVQTSGTVEGANTVSIGFHYVATDAYGNPLDSNGDGIADYLEDPNGNGVFDAGEPGDWQGLNLNVIITRPRNGSALP